MKRQSMVRKIVNLSPLVDVFMIVIFWYIMFSNQNLHNQEMASQSMMEEIMDELENLKEQKGELEEEKAALEEKKIVLEEEKIALEEKIAALDGEKAALEEEKAALEEENDRMKGLMEREMIFVELWLLGEEMEETGNSSIGTEELTINIAENEYTITFNRNQEDREKVAWELKTLLSEYLEKEERLYVIFFYNGKRVYSRDVKVVVTTLEELQKEQYFVYTLMNVSR